MRFRRLPLLLLAMLVVSSCDGDGLLQTINPPAPALTIEELIVADCYVLRDALEAFAAENGGVYPYDLTDPWGFEHAFITYLPGGQPLTNRYTGLATGPIFYDAHWPGEIGIVRYAEESGPASGYRIVGRGRYGELIRLENLAQISQSTIDAYEQVFANCDTTVAAAEEFARLAGSYPSDTSSDWPLGLFTIIDLLPNGELLLNPFSETRVDPYDGNDLGVPGAIGYLSWMWGNGGEFSTYIIDAYGADGHVIVERRPDSMEDEGVRLAAVDLNDAAKEFASRNGGEYPRDLDTDQTSAGDTMRDLVSNRLNPYTGASAYRDGLATSRGEVGYVPYDFNGIVVGYMINALGLFNEELERFQVLTN